MKICATLFILLLVSKFALAQAPRFQKYPVSTTNAFIYMPQEPVWDISMSEDSSIIYMADTEIDSIDYAAIIVHFNASMGNDKETWSNVLTSYIEYLASNVFELEEMMPLGYGHTLESHPEAIGAITFGIDYDGYNYKIKGWMDSEYMAILMVVGEKEANFNLQELFLNGFRFPKP